MINKLVDNTKIGGIVDSEEGYLRLQRDLDQLGQWAEEWQVEFNLDKCEVFHFVKTNKGITYTVNGRTLGSVVEQRDLEVQVHSSLKVASQVDRVVKKVFSMLAFIAQTIEYRSWNVILRLYRMFVSPLLEYCIQFWLPCCRKNIIKLERVQKRFMRMLLGLEVLSYKDRLGHFSLECSRLRLPYIEVYKIMKGIDTVDSKGLFHKMGEFKTRGHIFKERFRGIWAKRRQ
eukprot:g21957.t1